MRILIGENEHVICYKRDVTLI